MIKETFKLEALRYYGGRSALAILAFNGNRGVYTIEGINDLLEQYKGHKASKELKYIKEKMQEPGEFKDIQDDDFSGQETIF